MKMIRQEVLDRAKAGDPEAKAEFYRWLINVSNETPSVRKPRLSEISPPISEYPQRARDEVIRRRVRKAGWFRRQVVRAARTCTLWRPCYYGDYYEFILWRRWKITALEMAEVSGC